MFLTHFYFLQVLPLMSSFHIKGVLSYLDVHLKMLSLTDNHRLQKKYVYYISVYNVGFLFSLLFSYFRSTYIFNPSICLYICVSVCLFVAVIWIIFPCLSSGP